MTTADDARPKEFEGRISESKDWREIVAWVSDLPPMPQVASRAMQMVENPDTTAKELTDLLANDTALAARVLKIANSAMFSRQREITTLNQAIMMIGFKALKGIIVAATLRQLNKSFGNLQKLIWENSMCTAMAATTLAKRLKKRYTEEIFLLGLLHSLGQIVLILQTSKEYQTVIKLIEDQKIDYVSAEQQVLGFAHPLIGALFAKKWNFSAETCQAILHYRDPIESPKPESELEEKTAIVQLADIVCHCAGIGNPPGYPDESAKVATLATYVGFPADQIPTLLEDVVNSTKDQFQKESGIYS
jgi:HD-like signal output (HDOD) protein